MLSNFFVAAPIVSLRCIRGEKVMAIYADGTNSTLTLEDLMAEPRKPLPFEAVEVVPHPDPAKISKYAVCPCPGHDPRAIKGKKEKALTL